MRQFAVDFLLEGKRVDRQYVTAHNLNHARVIAWRQTSVAEYDDIEVNPL